jgi:hypothetical protein
MTNTQAKYGLSAALLSLAAAGIVFTLISTPQPGGAEDMAALAPGLGSGHVAALPTPVAIAPEMPARQNEKWDETFGWTEFPVGVDAFGGTPAAKPQEDYAISEELYVD